MTRRALIFAAGLLGVAGIAARAFEAHGLLELPDMSEPRLRDFSAAAEMLLIHAPAMLALAAMAEALPRIARWSGILLALGLLLFAGPLLIYGLTSGRALIMLTPFGGVALILGWVFIAFGGAIGLTRRGGT